MNACRLAWTFSLALTLLGLTLSSVGDSAASLPAQEPDKKAEKRFAMEFDKTPWAKVFEWYSDQSQKPYASKWPAPAGTFTYSTPKGRTYTLYELTAIIDESLMKKGYVLVPRPETCTTMKIATK